MDQDACQLPAPRAGPAARVGAGGGWQCGAVSAGTDGARGRAKNCECRGSGRHRKNTQRVECHDRARQSEHAELGRVRYGIWGPTRSWQPGPTGDAPLRGLRVLDFTRVLAGPTAARTLAVFGASVLRIDPPQLPEIIGQHIETGFGKRSATVDADSRAGRRQLEDLLSKADAVLLGYRPGALERHGLSVQGLRERFPYLVLVTLDAWGMRTPGSGDAVLTASFRPPPGLQNIIERRVVRPAPCPCRLWTTPPGTAWRQRPSPCLQNALAAESAGWPISRWHAPPGNSLTPRCRRLGRSGCRTRHCGRCRARMEP